MKRVAIIGCGAIGGVIARAVDQGSVRAELVALMDARPDACRELASRLERSRPAITSRLEDVLALNPDIVVEAASQEAVREYAKRILERSDLLVLSVGALMEEQTLRELLEVARRSGRRIYVPAGAAGGLDVLKAYSQVGVSRLKLVTRKPAKSLGAEVQGPTVVFRGRASEAVKAYPKSLNVAATLSLAAGVEAEVEVVADPSLSRNVHEVVAESPAGRVRVTLENVPSPENPKTSYLAALSAVRVLKEICSAEGGLVIL
ncbi:aspartate dehydrogenase [Infirmifilum sp. NZ]|uniref:aspartate dehydrogenase n=1 Tax=Infirmifilum sp. NZ TaxID=2926850 RepID=UPI00279FE478|nr:aspartate dehydrogenase [Infirmifilum sp. NZ]UNQ73888.1 aspartate dehydrogenase [Infirmifilum sp. NZ]